MTARPRPHLLALLAAGALAVACRTPPSRAPASAGATPPAARAAEPATDDADPGVLVVRAWQANRDGDAERALRLLERAASLGLDIPQDARDFPGLPERPEWKALEQTLGGREPRTARAEVAVTLPEPGLVAEGLAADPDGPTLYVSSIRARKILRVGEDGAVGELVPAAGGGLLSPLGMKVDAARGLLWVAANASRAMDGWDASLRGTSGVFAFDRRTGELRRKVLLTGGDHFLNDVAIAPDGTVFVTDSNAGAVHRLDPGATALRPAVAGGFFYPNGVVVRGAHVLFAHALGLHAFPLAGGEPVPVRGPVGFALGGIDGLALQGDALFAVQNGLGRPRIVRLGLEPSSLRIAEAAVLETANPAWRVPTTGAFARGGFVYIGNSHVDAVTEDGVGSAAMVETQLLLLPMR